MRACDGQPRPVDRIKLDRTVTAELPGEAGRLLVRGVLVAEGVETVQLAAQA